MRIISSTILRSLLLVVFAITLCVSETSCGGKSGSQTSCDSIPACLKGLFIDMVAIEGGSFKMGEAGKDTTVASFKICRYEVTQQQGDSVMHRNPSKVKSGGRNPVEEVSWEDCHLFIERLNALTGKHYRLPTEAEWEFAARGGKDGCRENLTYAGSNICDEVAVYDCYAVREVGTKLPNQLGLFDMSGNVWEWCEDATSEAGYRTDGSTKTGGNKVTKGGCYINSERSCDPRHMRPTVLDAHADGLGLRLAMDINQQ